MSFTTETVERLTSMEFEQHSKAHFRNVRWILREQNDQGRGVTSVCPPTFCSLCLACWNTLPAVLTNLSQTVKQFVFTAAVASFDSNTCNSAMAILLYFIVCEKNCCSEIGNCHRDTIKFLEAIPQISIVATNVIKLPSQKWWTLRKTSCYWAEEYATSQYVAV